MLAEVAENVQEELDRYGITDLIGKYSFFHTIPELESAYLSKNKPCS